MAGANIAFPRALLEKLNGFLIGLDRTGNNLLSNGEILMEQRIRQEGLSLYYDPEICVKHLVPANRLTKKWFMRRWYWQGVSNAIVELYGLNISKSSKIKLGLYRLRKIAFSPKYIVALIRPANDSKLFLQRCNTYGRIGEILCLLGFAK